MDAEDCVEYVDLERGCGDDEGPLGTACDAETGSVAEPDTVVADVECTAAGECCIGVELDAGVAGYGYAYGYGTGAAEMTDERRGGDLAGYESCGECYGDDRCCRKVV